MMSRSEQVEQILLDRGLHQLGRFPIEGIYHLVFKGRIYTGFSTDFRRRLITHTNSTPIGAFGRIWQNYKGDEIDAAVCVQLPRFYQKEKIRQAEARITFESYLTFRDAVLNQQYERFIGLKRRVAQGYDIEYVSGGYWGIALDGPEMRAEKGVILYQTDGFKDKIWEMRNTKRRNYAETHR